MWEPQLAAFSKHFRVIRYDSRGHGKSGAPHGPYTMERLGRDAVEVLNHFRIEKIELVWPVDGRNGWPMAWS